VPCAQLPHPASRLARRVGSMAMAGGALYTRRARRVHTQSRGRGGRGRDSFINVSLLLLTSFSLYT